MEERRRAYRVLVWKPEEKRDNLEEPSAHGRIILR
jgi:hypothetical protein